MNRYVIENSNNEPMKYELEDTYKKIVQARRILANVLKEVRREIREAEGFEINNQGYGLEGLSEVYKSLEIALDELNRSEDMIATRGYLDKS